MDDFKSDAFSNIVNQALCGYERLHVGQLTFGTFLPLSKTPDKPNTARTQGPAMYQGRYAGVMYIIAFSPGDGTGDAKTYSLESLVIPADLTFSDKPERVIPRSKAGVACEGFFPLFSIRENGTAAMFSTALDMLTVDDIVNPKSVVRGWRLGLSDVEYAQRLGGRTTAAQAYRTVGEDVQGRRFGDPHAIFYDPKVGGRLQVAGFLALQEGDPLLNIAKGWSMPKAYQRG